MNFQTVDLLSRRASHPLRQRTNDEVHGTADRLAQRKQRSPPLATSEIALSGSEYPARALSAWPWNICSWRLDGKSFLPLAAIPCHQSRGAHRDVSPAPELRNHKHQGIGRYEAELDCLSGAAVTLIMLNVLTWFLGLVVTLTKRLRTETSVAPETW